MHTNKISKIIALLLALTLLMAACAPVPAGDAGTSGDAMDAAGPTTITWAMWGSPAEIETHQGVADAFMAAEPRHSGGDLQRAMGRLLYQDSDVVG